MESSDSNRSTKIPIRASVTSELETTDGEGMFTETADGFDLEFSAGQDSYNICHCDERTSVSAKGLVSYCIELCGTPTRASIDTRFGSLDCTVTTVKRKAVRNADGVTLELDFVLRHDNTDDIARSVVVNARFLR